MQTKLSYEQEAQVQDHDMRITPNKNLQSVGLIASGVLLFMCSLAGIGTGFKLVFSEWANFFLAIIGSEVAPFTGLAAGVLCSALLESSSAVIATTIISLSSMVAVGLPLATAVRFGIPFILGANLGTTVGNTITLFAIRKATTKEEFHTTIPGVIIDDMYKFLNVSLFFILEVTTGFLSNVAMAVGSLIDKAGLGGSIGLFEKDVIDILIVDPIIGPLKSALRYFLGSQLTGIVFLVLWFGVLIFAIDFLITRGLRSLLETDWEGKVSRAFRSRIESFVTGFSISWISGSSSVGTSMLIPMLATKIASLEMALPYVVGCGLATTVDLSQLYGYFAGGITGIMLGSAHIILNVFSVFVWLVSPLRVLPMRMAKAVGQRIISSNHAALSLIGYALMFVIVPLMVLLITQRI